MNKTILLAIMIMLVVSASLTADDREEPIDVIIALDKSLSMEEEIEAVKEYVNEFIIDRLLIPGDFFLVVAFYGKSEIPLAMTIGDTADKAKARSLVSALQADGPFTDIGNALDRLGRELAQRSGPERKKYLLLITDGIQEAPPESKYYAPDGSFNHEFLENTKIIQKKGWKIHVLGIGTYQAAQELAQELAGKYTGVSQEPTAEELEKITKDFLATLEMAGKPVLSGINRQGKARLILTVQSKGYAEEKLIKVRAIELSVPAMRIDRGNILLEAYSLAVPAEGSAKARIPVRLAPGLQRGDYSGEVRFLFSGQEQFIPAISELEFHVKSNLENYWWMILLGLALLAMLVLGVTVLIPRTVGLPKLRFRLIVEDQSLNKGEELFTLKQGKFLFLSEEKDIIGLSKARNPHCIAKLSVFAGGLRMYLLKEDRFPKLPELPPNVLDFDFRVRMESGKSVNVRLGSMIKDA